MTTIIERAARAVAEKLNADAMAMPGKRATDADVVRAVLQAIREPSEGMVEAAEDTREPCESGGYYSEDLPSPDIVWKAMIDAALEEG